MNHKDTKTRRHKELCAAVSVSLCLCAFVFAQTPASEWRQFRGNPRLTGVAASAPANPKLLWTYDAGDSIESSAAIADGVVYVGVGKGDLIAVDFATGKLRWKYSTGNFIGESSPAVGANAVYVGDLDGILHAVNTDRKSV